jgi:hypothetical protein
VLRDHLDALAARRAARHEPMRADPVFVSTGHFLLPAAVVTELDAVVLIAALVGPDAASMLAAADTADACGWICCPAACSAPFGLVGPDEVSSG